MVFESCKFKPQMLFCLACVTLLERTSPKSLTSTSHRRMIFSFRILDLLETAYIWVCMSVMPHKEKHKYSQRVLCSATVHECFSFCSSDGFAIVWLMHIHVKHLKIGSCKHFELIDTPVEEYVELFCGSSGGLWRCGRRGWTPAVQVIHVRHDQFPPLLWHTV